MGIESNQVNVELKVRSLLMRAKAQERLASEESADDTATMDYAEQLRAEAQDAGKVLPEDVWERLLGDYLADNIVD